MAGGERWKGWPGSWPSISPKARQPLADVNSPHPPCPNAIRAVNVRITFDYDYYDPVNPLPNHAYRYVPSGGTYTIGLRQECRDRLTVGSVKGLAEKFRVGCANVGQFCEMSFNWSNGPFDDFGDYVVPSLPAAAGVIKDPRAFVEPNLFA